MKLAYSTNAYMRYPLVEAIDRIADLGYDGVEVMADTPHAWPATTDDRQIELIRSHIRDRAVAISNVNAFMMNTIQDFWHPSWIEPDASYRRLRVQHTIDALSMAARLGASCITTEPGGPLADGMSRKAALDLFITGMSEALTHAESEGVALLVEPEPGLLIETADQFLELAGAVDSPMFGLNFDIGHFYCVGDPLPETVARLASHTRHYHVEDIAATRVHKHLIPGHGAIDFCAVMNAIKRTGYDGWLTVELYPYLDDPDGAGADAREFLLRLMPT